MARKEHFAGSSSSATATEDRRDAIEFVFEANIGRSIVNGYTVPGEVSTIAVGSRPSIVSANSK
jgi:hypothetical protein